MRVVMASILICSHLVCANEIATSKNPSITITTESIATYRDNKFESFIKARQRQFATAESISSIPIVGSIFDWGLSAIKGVDMEKAKKFFDRIKAEGQAFYNRLQTFELNQNNIDYLNAIFSRLTPEMVAKKSTEDLSQAIESLKEKYFPGSEKMYDTNDDAKYTYSNEKFTDYALCNLLAAHIVNSAPPIKKGWRRRK